MTVTAELSRVVTWDDTAAAWGDAFPAAASTPFVLALAELASHQAVSETLDDGELTVGTSATVEHLGASRVGATLRAVATVLESEGKRIRFEIEVFDGERCVARVDHRRAVAKRTSIESALERT